MCFRTLIESEQFKAEKSKINPDIKRLDDMLNSVTWALAQHPEHFEHIPGTQRLYRVNTDPFPDAPPVRIWYTFDDTAVELLSIELADDTI